MKKLSLISLFASLILLAQPVSQTMAMDEQLAPAVAQGLGEFFNDTRNVLLESASTMLTPLMHAPLKALDLLAKTVAQKELMGVQSPDVTKAFQNDMIDIYLKHAANRTENLIAHKGLIRTEAIIYCTGFGLFFLACLACGIYDYYNPKKPNTYTYEEQE